ncbi:MAG: hypothetical protein QMC79_00450 [Anaerosomatales bacterium]|nr:hypothetical protein [Anaerosomatales bacterium]
MACWSDRGCDDEMRSRCPHAIDPTERCPASCRFADCERPTRSVASPLLLLDPDVDRTATMKETCVSCAFFLENGPRTR